MARVSQKQARDAMDGRLRSGHLVPPFRALAAILALLALSMGGCGKRTKAVAEPPTVLVAPVRREPVALHVETVGTLDGYVNAEIRARVRGYLESQSYKEGASVRKGQILFTLEPTEYVAAVASAKGTLERARAAQRNADIQLARAKTLVAKGSVPQAEEDDSVAAMSDANGQVQAAEAALRKATLDLSYTRVQSPVDGVAGLALVRIGNLVGQDGPTLLTTVSQIDPIRVNFPMSEIDYVRSPDRIKRLGERDLAWVRAQLAAFERGQTAEAGDPGVELVLADGRTYPKKGIIVAANRQVDPSTGTIQMQAVFPNRDGMLRPGQYGRVRIRREDIEPTSLVVPERALIAVQGTYSVGVVGPDDTVRVRRLDLGASTQGARIVNQGVNEGERIVVDGTQDVKDGVKVTPKPAP